jgi:DNA-binding NarL/FixJ family response regulator
VFSLIASGRTITDISDQLSLSVKTISTYRSRILVKLNLKTNADLARYAVQHHIVE